MKKFLLTFAALLSMTMVMAQGENGYGRKAPQQMTSEEMLSQMTNKLGLNNEQKTKVAALNKEYQDVFQRPNFGNFQGRNNNGSSNANGRPQMTDEMKAQMKERMSRRQDYEKKLKGILSDSQYQTYQQMMPKRGHGGMGGHNHQRQSPDNQ
ncbi:MAG: DUF4890 domain-containing protein [Prevotella sp.]|nr:DUF4890 domain-containing protein [Prevotella sp.]